MLKKLHSRKTGHTRGFNCSFINELTAHRVKSFIRSANLGTKSCFPYLAQMGYPLNAIRIPTDNGRSLTSSSLNVSVKLEDNPLV